MTHRTLRASAFRSDLRLAALALGAACALCLPASNARASAPPGHYTIAGGTVTDNATKLVWQQVVGSYNTWKGAKSYCAGLVLAGHSDWRVPSVKELMTLVDFSVAPPGPTVDAKAFPGTPATWFWTSSPLAGQPSLAWGVYFYGGVTGYGDVTWLSRVRCVR